MAMFNVIWVLVVMLVLTMGNATPPGIANNPSHARCLIKKYKMCYNLEHVCPKFCPDSCTVECVSCKPICGAQAPEEATPPTPVTPASPPPPEEVTPPPSPPTPVTPSSPPLPTPVTPSSPPPPPEEVITPPPSPPTPVTPSSAPPPVEVTPSSPPPTPSSPSPPEEVTPSSPPPTPVTQSPPPSEEVTPSSPPTPETPPSSPPPTTPETPSLSPPPPTPETPSSSSPPSPPTPETPSSSPPPPTPETPPSPPPTTPSPATPPPTTPTTTLSSPPTTPLASPPPEDSSEAAAGMRKRCKNKDYPQCYDVEHVCPSSCPHTCEIDCVTCKPVCKCDMPGAVCQDPRFIGGDGITFYFHGKKNQDFCLVTDPNLHINAHFIGKRNENMKRDFTWVQSIGILFGNHRIFLGAQKTAIWNDAIDRLSLSFDGEPIVLPISQGATWQPQSFPSTTVKREGNDANSITIEVDGIFKISANVVPITKHESDVHNYGITDDDCFAHLELGFKFYLLGGKVNGILGQTYASDYVSKVKMGVSMPVLGGEREFRVSNLFNPDCMVSQFDGKATRNGIATAF